MYDYFNFFIVSSWATFGIFIHCHYVVCILNGVIITWCSRACMIHFTSSDLWMSNSKTGGYINIHIYSKTLNDVKRVIKENHRRRKFSLINELNDSVCFAAYSLCIFPQSVTVWLCCFYSYSCVTTAGPFNISLSQADNSIVTLVSYTHVLSPSCKYLQEACVRVV